MNDAARLRAQKRASTDPERLERMAQLAEKMETKMTTISKDDEKAAREWAEGVTAHRVAGLGRLGIVARTILALLDRPVMPRNHEVPDAAIHRIGRVCYANDAQVRGIIDALHEWATKPAEPVKVEAWAVVFDDTSFVNELWGSKAQAERRVTEFTAGKARAVRMVEADNAD